MIEGNSEYKENANYTPLVNCTWIYKFDIQQV